jgi:hypothetical protein
MVGVIRIKSDFFELAIIAVARLRYASPRDANKLPTKKAPLLILIISNNTIYYCSYDL